MTHSKRHRIARQVRAWAERTAKKEGFPEDLMGLCARSSAQLFTLYKQAGELPLIAYSVRHSHFFVLVEGYIVDVTATQFPATRKIVVFIALLKDAEKLTQYDYDRIIVNPEKLIAYQRATKWHQKQTAKLSQLMEGIDDSTYHTRCGSRHN
jgi:hypothetical protein